MKHWHFFLVTAVCLFFLAACSRGPKLTYTVNGTAATAQIAYRDGKGDMVFDTVNLPWEKTIRIDDAFHYEMNVERTTRKGNVSCIISLNGKEVGRITGATFVECRGQYQGGKTSLEGRFDQQNE